MSAFCMSGGAMTDINLRNYCNFILQSQRNVSRTNGLHELVLRLGFYVRVVTLSSFSIWSIFQNKKGKYSNWTKIRCWKRQQNPKCMGFYNGIVDDIFCSSETVSVLLSKCCVKIGHKLKLSIVIFNFTNSVRKTNLLVVDKSNFKLCLVYSYIFHFELHDMYSLIMAHLQGKLSKLVLYISVANKAT